MPKQEIDLVYLVVGFYWKNRQRFAQHFAAFSPEQAEAKAMARHPGLTVVAVINQLGDVVG